MNTSWTNNGKISSEVLFDDLASLYLVWTRAWMGTSSDQGYQRRKWDDSRSGRLRWAIKKSQTTLSFVCGSGLSRNRTLQSLRGLAWAVGFIEILNAFISLIRVNSIDQADRWFWPIYTRAYRFAFSFRSAWSFVFSLFTCSDTNSSVQTTRLYLRTFYGISWIELAVP